MAESPQDTADAGRKDSPWRAVVWLGLMVLAVFVAWAAARGLRSYLQSAHSAGREEAKHVGPATRPDWQPKGPDEMFGRPFESVGLLRLDTDPGNIPPPPGAKRLYGFQRRQSQEIEQHARYEFHGTADEAAEHYVRAFEAAGLKLLKDAVEPTGRRVLVFQKQGLYATVGLRTDLQTAKMVVVVVTVTKPVSTQRGGVR